MLSWYRITRPKGRVRIETISQHQANALPPGITRPKGRVRIETVSLLDFARDIMAHHPAERPGAD